ncbi:MAG: ECF transporter S component [Anaerolineales bacterium]|nr:MAG: ECF transporter S component [Anaerolineales bacterium]
MAKNSSKGKWSTRDLLVTIVIGLAFGVLLIPVTWAYAGLLSAGGIFTRAILGGLYFLPAAFAAYVMRKPGATILASVLSALPSMLGPYSLIVLMIGALIGLVGELFVWLLTRYKNFTTARMLWLGMASGITVYLLILGSMLRTTAFEPSILLIAAVVSAAVFAACSLVARYLANSVVKTGVLANTALGETTADEI